MQAFKVLFILASTATAVEAAVLNAEFRHALPGPAESLAPQTPPTARGVPNTSEVRRDNIFEKRACSLDAPYGCSLEKGRCWKACGDMKKGEWCWTASNSGTGSWATCSSWNDCGTDSVLFGCGRNCVEKPTECGCGC
jgi:hypothetical protein